MAFETLTSALEQLEGTLAGLDKAVTKAEMKLKTAGKKGGNQLDMFGAPAPATVGPDAIRVAGQLDRVIAKIESVLTNKAA